MQNQKTNQNETKYWLCLLRDSKRAESGGIDKLLQEAVELSNILEASLLTMKGKR